MLPDFLVTLREHTSFWPNTDRDILFVLCEVLQIPHLACQEAALHGLGHFARRDQPRVAAIIYRFLSDRPKIDPSIRNYALIVREGKNH
jgi:hypothetical protein